jgi:hypothetical protein
MILHLLGTISILFSLFTGFFLVFEQTSALYYEGALCMCLLLLLLLHVSSAAHTVLSQECV